MSKGIYNGFVRGLRGLLRRTALREWSVAGGSVKAGPAVYVAHHQNLRGPVRATALLPEEARIWVFHVFCHRKSCFRQYYDYTLTRRLRWPSPAAFAAAGLLSLAIPSFLRGLGVVPVFRGSREIRRTMERSEEALLRGENLLICPDRDYARDDCGMGDIYKGFLHLERIYYKRTGEHLAFVPLSFDENGKCMVIGETVCFTGETHFAREAERVARQLRSRINGEAETPGETGTSAPAGLC